MTLPPRRPRGTRLSTLLRRHWPLLAVAGLAALVAGCVRMNVHGDPDAWSNAMRERAPVRVATYNTSLYAEQAGGLVARLRAGDEAARNVAAVLQRVRLRRRRRGRDPVPAPRPGAAAGGRRRTTALPVPLPGAGQHRRAQWPGPRSGRQGWRRGPGAWQRCLGLRAAPRAIRHAGAL